jgi:ankyrin repeat protein
MNRVILALAFLLSCACAWAAQENQPEYPSFDYEAARTHEIKPHRRAIPHAGIREGENQLHLTLTVSPAGAVLDAKAEGEEKILKFWPDLRPEVLRWKFIPFEMDGRPVTASIDEYIDLVPPEQFPLIHMPAPTVRPDSMVSITLSRSGCYGTCPAYRVSISTDGIVFEGRSFVVATGRHTDTVDPRAVRELAKKFVAADFYSMNDEYQASVTDNPSYTLSISIDDHTKQVLDYVGPWVGMPEVITDLEDDVDALAHTERWIEGSDGLVSALKAEGLNFNSYPAQVILKEAARRGRSETIHDLLAAGVPLEPIPAPKPKNEYQGVALENEGWLNVASGHLDALKVFVQAGASKHDQNDKDLALAGAANSGNFEGAQELIAYGANPNVDLSKTRVTEHWGDGATVQGDGAGSILIYAASSGNPDLVQLILRYHPKLEARDREGKTAMFAAGDWRESDKDGARVEIVRLLARAGANVNARDSDGNTPLHEIYLTDVEEELLKLGADVNARNNDGETPIFTNVDDDSIPLFIAHGADLTIRNKKGQTVFEAAKDKGPQRQAALRKATQNPPKH